MSKRTTPPGDTPRREASRRGGGKQGGARHQVASLRITSVEIAHKELVRLLYPEADNETDLAYRIWRRGLQFDLARIASMGERLPEGIAEDQLAMLIVQDVLACLPLLQRTGRLSQILALLNAAPLRQDESEGCEPGAPEIDASAADSIADLGGGDFM